jgi:hypothetical protein
MLFTSVTFASAQVCDPAEEGCEEDFRPGATVDREFGVISVFTPFQPGNPYLVILPPSPIYPVDPIYPTDPVRIINPGNR